MKMRVMWAEPFEVYASEEGLRACLQGIAAAMRPPLEPWTRLWHLLAGQDAVEEEDGVRVRRVPLPHPLLLRLCVNETSALFSKADGMCLRAANPDRRQDFAGLFYDGEIELSLSNAAWRPATASDASLFADSKGPCRATLALRRLCHTRVVRDEPKARGSRLARVATALLDKL